MWTKRQPRRAAGQLATPCRVVWRKQLQKLHMRRSLTCACGLRRHRGIVLKIAPPLTKFISSGRTGPPASEHGNGGLPKERTIACFFCAAPATLIAFHIIIAYPRYYFVHYLFVEGNFTDMTAQLLSTRACDISISHARNNGNGRSC